MVFRTPLQRYRVGVTTVVVPVNPAILIPVQPLITHQPLPTDCVLCHQPEFPPHIPAPLSDQCALFEPLVRIFVTTVPHGNLRPYRKSRPNRINRLNAQFMMDRGYAGEKLVLLKVFTVIALPTIEPFNK